MIEKIKKVLKELKMHSSLENLENYLHQFQDRESFILGLLEAELIAKERRSANRRILLANFPLDREWSMLDPKRNQKINFNEVKILSNGSFVKEKCNICLIGAPGLGKTHSVVSIGKDLCRKGLTVKTYVASALVTKLEEAKLNGVLSKFMEAIKRPDLLIIDELGFVPFSDNGARLLFDVFARRYENGSIAVTTNLTFNKWPSIFGSIELTSALVDRFTHRCHVFAYEGPSVRLADAIKTKKSKEIDDEPKI